MRFPLDIITGYLEESGMRLIKAPARPQDHFAWVSAHYDAQRDGAPSSGPIADPPVYVVDASVRMPERLTVIAVRKPGQSAANAQQVKAGNNDNNISVESELDPPLLADRLQRYLMSIVQWNDAMADMIDAGCICRDLLAASEDVLGCYVGLSDSTYSYIAHTPNIAPIDEVSEHFVQNRFYSASALRTAREMGLVRIWEHQDKTVVNNSPNALIAHPTANRVLRAGGTYAAHLLMVSPKPVSTARAFLFDLLAKKIEVCLTHHWRLENPLAQRYTYFLNELLSGNTYDDSHLEERARLHGLPLTGLFEMCLVDNTWRVGSPSYFAKKVLEAAPESKVALEGSRVVVLLCETDSKRKKTTAMEARLFELAQRMHLEVGVSDCYENIGQSALALEKARIALTYGHRRSRRFTAFDEGSSPDGNSPGGVFRFRRYFPYFATDPFEHGEKFVSKLLASPNPLSALRQADRQRNANDYEILRTYLYCEGSIKRVCEIMHMHRNTVNYRLDKIRTITDTDLDDPDMRMYLRMLYLLSE